MSWEKAVSLEQLNKKGKALFKKGSKQVVLFKVGENIRAIDNRCPHQGYPLMQGALDGEVLTCNWHNWKFELDTGKCILGGDDVQAYETKVEEGEIWVHLKEPSQEEVFEKSLKSFKTAFIGKKNGRISRELARLIYTGIDPTLFLKEAILLSYKKLKNGMTHSYAAAAGWLTLYKESEGNKENQLICLMEAINHMADDVLREKEYSYAEKSEPYSYNAFIEAVEKEDQEKACALINGALESGQHFKDVEKALTFASLMHYNDFGHALIYVVKVGELVKYLGEEVEKPLLLSLTRSLCLSTREDLLPEFQKYSDFLKNYKEGTSVESKDINSEDIFRKTVNASMEWTLEAVKKYEAQGIFDALLESNAKNLLAFNTEFHFAYDKPVSQHVGWLDFTHALTFANAVRLQCEKYPEFWKYGLLQLACFNGRNSSFLEKQLDDTAWEVEGLDQFFTDSYDQILDHGIGVPIIAAHLLKTTLAVREEVKNHPASQKHLLGALNRFLNSPYKQKHTRRTAIKALELVGRDFK